MTTRARALIVAGLVVAPFAVGLVARLLPFFFPLPIGSGGFFAVMTEELRAGAWPMTTAYNDSGIPFAYPPLGLQLLAALPGEGPQEHPGLTAMARRCGSRAGQR